MAATCPNCAATIEAQSDNAAEPPVCPHCTARLGSASAQQASAETIAIGSPPTVVVSDTAALARTSQANLPEIPGYEMLDVLGRGGMGVVLKARHRVLNRLVAVKMPLSDVLGDESFLKRFLLEARTAASLQHPNICPVYDVGQHEDRPYIAMAFISGVTLRDWAKAQKPTPRQAAEIVAKVARAVGYAHQHNLIHRDIKPANVMITSENGEPILMDFGLAKEVAADSTQLTHSGDLVGTPAYMAPEQAAGHLNEITTRTDIYALGIMLYELLCGAPPFTGSSGDIFVKIQTEEPSSPRSRVPQLHRDLETICLKAIAKQPSKRYDTAIALAEDLERFCAGEAILARRESWVEKMARRARRNRTAAAAIVGVVALAVVAAIVAVHARTAKQISALTTQLQQCLDSPSWSAEQLAEADQIVMQLARLEPRTADKQRSRVIDQLAASIRQAVQRPNLTEADNRQIEASIAALALRDPSRAAQLRQELGLRLLQWLPVYSLKPPFDNVQKLPVRSTTNASDGVSFTQQRVELPVAFTGNVRMEAEFSSVQTADKGVGFAMQDEKGRGYEFRLTPAIRARTNATPSRVFLDLDAPDIARKITGWYANTPNTVSIVMENGRPILRLENRNENAKLVSLNQWFDPSLHPNKEWELAFRYRISNFQSIAGANTNNWDCGARVLIEGKRSNGSYPGVNLRRAKNCDWTPTTMRCRVPNDVPRLRFAFEIRSATGRLEVSDITLTERDAGSPAGSHAKHLFTLPQQPWRPEGSTADIWMVDGDKKNAIIAEENGKRLLRFTNDGTIERNSVVTCFRVDPQAIETVTVTARVRVNQYEPRTPDTQTNALAFIIATVKDALGRGRKTAYWGFRSTSDWSTKSFPITIPPDADTLMLGPVATSCRASMDIAKLECTLKRKSTEIGRPGQSSLTIQRGNKVLRERFLLVAALDAKSVRLAVERVGDLLRIQVGDEPPVEVVDPFPVAAKDSRLTLLTSGDVRLRSLSICRHSLPGKPNPLEIGDGLFATGRFSEAQAAYEAQTRASTDPETQQQARYKIALCLLQQKRPKDAEPVLALVAKSSSPTWSALAGCQLWAFYLGQQRMEEADTVFMALRTRPDFIQILSNLTQEMQNAIIDGYQYRARWILETGATADLHAGAERLQQVLEVGDALNMHPLQNRAAMAFRLAQTLAAIGQNNRAMELTRTQLEQFEKEDVVRAASSISPVQLSEFYFQLLAVAGHPEQALPLLERLDQRAPHSGFTVSLARCLFALNRLSEAEAKLSGVVANSLPFENNEICRHGLRANLLLGLIAEKQQGSKAAQQVWGEAYRRMSQAAPNGKPPEWAGRGARGELVDTVMLACLGGELRDDDMPGIKKRFGDTIFQTQTGEDVTAKTPLQAFAGMLTRQSLLHLWSGKRGAVFSRDRIRGDRMVLENNQALISLLGEQVFIEGSIGWAALSDEVEAIYWNLTERLFEAFRKKQFTSVQLLTFGASWKGITNIFGWESLQSELPPALRGPMAFALGHRYIKLDKKEDAREMFLAAKKDAAQLPDGQALAKAAEEAVKKLAEK